MEDAAKSVATEIADDGKALSFCVFLDGVTDIAQCCAGFYDFDPFHHGIICDIAEAFCLYGDFIANIIHARCIAMPSIKNNGDVDVDDVTILQDFIAWDAVANNVVD